MNLSRGSLTDLYVEGGRSVVMVGEQVIVLSEVATAILEAVPPEQDVAVEEVTASVVAEFGEPAPPATAADLTLQQVHDLAAHKILVLDEQAASAPRTSASAVEALRSALRHLRSASEVRWSPPGDLPPLDLVAAARQHNAVSLLARHLDRLALPPAAGAALRHSDSQLRAGARVLGDELTRALDDLERAGVRALAVKGIALAVQAHGDVGARGAGDLDMLVPPRDVATAHAALVAAGWSPAPGTPSPGSTWAWRHYVSTGHELTLTGAASSIDLHWHLVPTHDTFPEFDELWERRDLVRIGGRDVPTLAPYDALTHSAGHAAKDHWRWLRSLYDVHLLASDPDTWRAATRPLRGDQSLSVGLAARLFGVPPGAPRVVTDAVEATTSLWEDVLEGQVSTSAVHQRPTVPGLGLVRSVRTLARTAGTPAEAARLLSRNVFPPWLTADEPSPHAVVAVPRILRRRAREVAGRLKGRA